MPAKKKTSSKKRTTSRKKTTSTSARKKGVKKSTTSTKKKGVRKAVLVCANDNECFWSTDGTIIANLVELKESLEHMADDVYRYHVTKEKNDFANWVEAVLGDRELGAALRKSRKPSSARSVVVRRLKIYDI